MPKTSYGVGERLNFTIHTYGICASPNVIVMGNDEPTGEALIIYEYRGTAIRCPPQDDPSDPYLKWEAERLAQRFGDEYFGGDGNSIITTNAAIILKKAGNYTISASLIDQSDSAARNFVVEDDGITITPTVRMNLSSLRAYTPIHELIGDVVPQMEFKKGEQVLFNATFANPSADKRLEGFVLTLGIRDENENPVPDDISIVTGDTMPGGTISVEHSWRPEKVGDYSIMIFSLGGSDLKSTMVVGPAAVIPIRVVK